MTAQTYLLYLAAVALLVLTPGPTMLMCMVNALRVGTLGALASVAGSVTAVLGVMLLSALGLGALLAASETAFLALKLAGAAYLVWLGIKTFRQPGRPWTVPEASSAAPRRLSALYLQGFLVGASNPKAVLFFTAFFPQFIQPAAPWAPQFALLAGTFIAIEFGVLSVCAIGAARLAPFMADGARMRWFNRGCGGLFALMGALLLLSRRPA